MTRSEALDGDVRRVLVTGADGKIGRAVVDALLDDGIAVTALSLAFDRPSPADRVLTADAADPEAVSEALRDVDVVVHLAAIPHPTLAEPFTGFRSNVSATFNVLTRSARHGVRRVVLASSINAFGVPMNAAAGAPAYFPIDERIPTDISDWYSLSKQCDELSAAMITRSTGMATAAIRFPHTDSRDRLLATAQSVLDDPAASMREGWSYLDLRDAVDVVRRAVRTPFGGSHVLHVSAPDTLVSRDTQELLDEYAPAVPVNKAVTGRAPLIDSSVARELLGFTARYSIWAPDGPIGDAAQPARLTGTSAR
ncbi:NAD(P)-dependent oxidoreductase [Herbiconiux sp. VKM Ac-1786]|uniref:NAD-dependent epimerase/dehydratase family protein n=1 Tax=Herbiconiux sp. VKM Ac-1786 TaxID=2783824 RepID=UPI00188C8B07|nr:NAD(P)-dependent oxidoreductase [Herbiconiux sp. VKM Ac-1786]